MKKKRGNKQKKAPSTGRKVLWLDLARAQRRRAERAVREAAIEGGALPREVALEAIREFDAADGRSKFAALAEFARGTNMTLEEFLATAAALDARIRRR